MAASSSFTSELPETVKSSDSFGELLRIADNFDLPEKSQLLKMGTMHNYAYAIC